MDLLDYMRSVIIQDACLLMEMDAYKEHNLFQHEIFKGSDFLAFQEQLLQVVSKNLAPEMVLLQQAMPLVAESIQGIHQDSIRIHDQLIQVNNQLAEIMATIRESTTETNDFSTMRTQLSAALHGVAHSIAGTQEAQDDQLVHDNNTVTTLAVRMTDNDAGQQQRVSCTNFKMSRQLYTVKQARIQRGH